ncbi:phosphoribosylformylglycinamidine cyclo-ligase [Carnobacterium divergens]|uniref:phosphoribosylformylglycinamidine cyclo-ligase n=2 Tax=Carnobacterium TaxID=2747 RepID=UPI001071FE19|nr:phosphoribosylformylglycinamidine cyclo-ligase [Carnobacterium divergens]MDT1940010.1 phosphoribosylformylglycinamidine cyclo-ligase [Carnobacterium divergens]MDT1942448.1 phosphoribosylformylglycinamidine cyclo-ligase [Carnobacterium divergens]MDT1948254.1 phosphoribosylformylglycinamidine cyclo-ligase [Carnobacterium divergens]MDT1950734.1 phosphoribosylformylglycinamidine cyclo-ligase [Carnobacterium divergens]MDT1956014.1 phosphoribosylformylglycinamidine cyclo-ligase [Carnobacterium di
MANAYSKAGVDVEAGYETVERIQKHVKKTERKGVMDMIGGFGGCFDLTQLNVKEPVLVSGTDGVGTKLMIAIQQNKHDTIGIDCVAMCVNDIVAQGAEPLYFLDYIATGKNVPARLEKVVAGVSDGCIQAGAALIGGETAEMPGMYNDDDYDLAGFAVGVAEKKELIKKADIKEEDILIGIASSGIHSNGYSLVRKVFFEQNEFDYDSLLPELKGEPLGSVLLTPTKIYVKALLPLIKERKIHGIAHITGGGFVENIPRMLPTNLAAHVQLGSWDVLPIFQALQLYGTIPAHEMYEIFNMGIGMVIAVSKDDVKGVLEQLEKAGEAASVIGWITKRTDEALILEEV